MEDAYNKKKSRKSEILTNRKGVAIILLLILMPLIITSIFLFYIGSIQLEMKSFVSQLCRHELMDSLNFSQKWVFDFINRNQQNNNPLLHSILKKHLDTEVHYFYKQKKRLILSKKEILKDQLEYYQQKTQSLMTLSNIKVDYKINFEYPVEIQNHFKNPLRQIYIVKTNVEEIERQTLTWSYNLSTHPSYFYWIHWSQNFNGQCSATLSKEKPWKPILSEDKHS